MTSPVEISMNGLMGEECVTVKIAESVEPGLVILGEASKGLVNVDVNEGDEFACVRFEYGNKKFSNSERFTSSRYRGGLKLRSPLVSEVLNKQGS